MTDTVKLNLCILWEGELRTASKLIREAFAEGISEEEQVKKAQIAWDAAVTALWGLTDDHACVLVGSDEIRKAARKATSNTSCPDVSFPETK